MIFGICLEGLAFSFLGVLVNVPEKTEPASWRGRGDEAASGVTTNNAKYGKNTNTDLFYFNAISSDIPRFKTVFPAETQVFNRISIVAGFSKSNLKWHHHGGLTTFGCLGIFVEIRRATIFQLDSDLGAALPNVKKSRHWQLSLPWKITGI
jgi:hypothetical protein